MKDIRSKAKKLGLCQDWQKKMKYAPSLQEYCQMFFDGSDWAMENDFPSLGLLRKYKEASIYGLYTDAKTVKRNHIKIAFFGLSDAVLNYDGHIVSEIYIRHKSSIKITAKDNAILFVTVADNAIVDIEVNDNAVVNVYRYGGTITGNLTINERSWEK
ncbi:hypothetical protein BAS10_04440 [Elizabethkingia meningoseptica]|uniref:hypothetical protein n=1 Tax=Elizabethkingia meningoseptica TaxID=238 RepID=UPI00099A5C3A|nr:hypothetical protein [Elizabethkingia meningoseptica]OPB98922.1 hypothetical protein BAS10_04440 [Elizabethkingia meningoseptica]